MLISLENVGKSFGGETLLKNINVSVNAGDRIGIIGENGAGKTTLLNMLTGNLENDEGAITVSENAVVGYLRQLDGLVLTNTVRQEMETVFSRSAKALEEQSLLEKELEADPENRRLVEEHSRLGNIIYAEDAYNAGFLIRKMLNGMGFSDEDREKTVSALSGGERTRLNIAKLLLENPDILILDEPTNHLDFDTLAWLEDYLTGYRGAVIAVSHDRYFLDRVALRIWEIKDGELSDYRGNYSAYEAQKREKIKIRQRRYEADLEKAEKLRDYVERNLVRASTTKMAQSRRRQLEKMDMAPKPRRERVPLEFRFEFSSVPYDEILTVENLSVRAGGKILMSGLDFTLRSKDRLIIAGANGRGKTTLINTLTGRIRPAAGKVRFGPGAVPAVFDQHVTVQGPDVITAVWDKRPSWTAFEVRSYLARFGYRGEDVFKSCAGLSGGERARLRFCLMSLDGANILFLDEPTNHLDIYMIQSVTKALAEYRGCIVTVTHDRYLMQRLDCPIMNIRDGKAVFYDSFEDFAAKRSADGFRPGRRKDNSGNSRNPSSPLNRKRIRRAAARDRRRLRELEKLMDELGRTVSRCNDDMQNPDTAADPEKMGRLWDKMSLAQRELARAEEEWLALNEKMGNL